MVRIGAIGAVLAMVGCGGETSRQDDILALDGDATAGATVYTDHCATCHGADGSGGTGPLVIGADEATTVDATLNGVGAMPPFADLDDQSIADVAAYLASL